MTPELEVALRKMAKEIETYIPKADDKEERMEEYTDINYRDTFNRNLEELKNIAGKFKKQLN